MKALITIIVVAILATGCASTGVSPTKVTYCEYQFLERGDWVFDLDTGEAGIVSIPCFIMDGVKYYEVIYESDGKRHLILDKHVAVLHRNGEGL